MGAASSTWPAITSTAPRPQEKVPMVTSSIMQMMDMEMKLVLNFAVELA